MVMFLFVIAYVGQRSDTVWTGGPSWQFVGGVLAGGAILVEVIIAIGLGASGRLRDAADIDAAFGSPREIGRLFLTDHLLAFEITSIVLLVAAVGGVVLGGQSRREVSEQ
jgi:NADH-quinone oxidoreductase subunit J